MNRKTQQSRQPRPAKRLLRSPPMQLRRKCRLRSRNVAFPAGTSSSQYRVISCPLLPSPTLLSEGSAGDFFAVSVQVTTWPEPVASPRILAISGRPIGASPTAPKEFACRPRLSPPSLTNAAVL